MSAVLEDSRVAIRGVAFLPFRIYPVRTEEEMQEARVLRHAAYERHGYPPSYLELVLKPDSRDTVGTASTLIARDKVTGKVVGTVRLLCNLDGPVPLGPTMPKDPLFEEPFVFIDRLAVADMKGAGLVTLALMKACWLWTRARQATWLCAGARRPMARRYEMAGLTRRESNPEGYYVSVFPDEPMFLVAATVEQAEANVSRKNPAFRQFNALAHADIRLW